MKKMPSLAITLVFVISLCMTSVAFADGATFGTAKSFEARALADLPLLSAKTFDADNPDPNGPQTDEVWIRIKTENGREARAIMAKTADLYRAVLGKTGPVTVIHWVGNKIYAKGQY